MHNGASSASIILAPAGGLGNPFSSLPGLVAPLSGKFSSDQSMPGYSASSACGQCISAYVVMACSSKSKSMVFETSSGDSWSISFLRSLTGSKGKVTNGGTGILSLSLKVETNAASRLANEILGKLFPPANQAAMPRVGSTACRCLPLRRNGRHWERNSPPNNCRHSLPTPMKRSLSLPSAKHKCRTMKAVASMLAFSGSFAFLVLFLLLLSKNHRWSVLLCVVGGTFR